MLVRLPVSLPSFAPFSSPAVKPVNGWLLWGETYYKHNRSELFAEWFSMFFYSPEGREKAGPAVHGFISQAVEQFTAEKTANAYARF
jgi:hypothetical protein